jgi:uncharacterized lipoprotein
MKNRVALIGILAALWALAACHPIQRIRDAGTSCRVNRPYQRAASVAPLKIPAGLDTPENANALHIPALNEPEPPPRNPKDPCLDEPPSFSIPKPAPPKA